MAITKKPIGAQPKPTLEKFIEAAPDGVKPGKPGEDERVQITLRMSREQLEHLSAVARRQAPRHPARQLYQARGVHPAGGGRAGQVMHATVATSIVA